MNAPIITTSLLIGLCSGCHPNQEERLAKMRSEFRALNLPGQLRNDRLKLSNDQLAIDIAKLEKKRPSLTQLQIDQIVLEGTEIAIEAANEIDRVLSRPDDASARDLRTRVSELDKRLDDLASACHSGASAAKTIEEARAACTDLTAMVKAIR